MLDRPPLLDSEQLKETADYVVFMQAGTRPRAPARWAGFTGAP